MKTTATVALLCLGAASPASSQETRLIDETPACRCELVFEHVATIGPGTLEGDGLAGKNDFIAVDGRGRFYVYPSTAPGTIQVFDGGGKLVAGIGTEGEGPGEFRSVTAIIPSAGDTIHVFDPRNRRQTVISPEYEVVETIPLPAAPRLKGVEARPGGGWIVNAHIATDERIGLPLHVMSATGELGSSFGSLDRIYRGDIPMMGMRAIVPLDRDRILSVRRREYLIEVWDTQNRALARLRRSPEWFQPWTTTGGPVGPNVVPRPYVTDAYVSGDGLLWVITTIAAENFADGLERQPSGEYWYADHDVVFDTVIDVIDLETGELLASERFDAFYRDFFGDSLLMAYRSEDGLPYLDISRVQLKRH